MPEERPDPAARPAANLRIGVTGHRPNRLREADMGLLRERAREALDLLRGTARELWGNSAPPPRLRILSPLAEGSDRLVAEEAVSLGFELESYLPFDRKEYEKDFEDTGSRAEFRALLAQASVVRELKGSRETRDREDTSYSAVGRLVLDSSDLLIAIWDGLQGKGEGGTAEIVRESLERGIPTIWISSRPPHKVNLLLPAEETPLEIGRDRMPEELKRLLRQIRDRNPAR